MNKQGSIIVSSLSEYNTMIETPYHSKIYRASFIVICSKDDMKFRKKRREPNKEEMLEIIEMVIKERNK